MISFLKRIWPAPSPSREAAESLYRKAVAQAREPAFYAALGVPDTVDGRFDMIVMHTGLIVRRLRAAGEGTVPWQVAQLMFDYMFVDFDRSLRELGVGDLSVGRHIKKMGKAWYARAAAGERGIDAAMSGDAKALPAALRETVFRARPDSAGVEPLARYFLRAERHISAQNVAVLARGEVDWDVAITEAAT